MEAVTASPPAPELDSPELYSNRELSWLQFNERVLELAEDTSLPLLERVKFLAIYASNLDEFYMVRVAGLHDMVDAGIDKPREDGRSPLETLTAIRAEVREHITRQCRCLQRELRIAKLLLWAGRHQPGRALPCATELRIELHRHLVVA